MTVFRTAVLFIAALTLVSGCKPTATSTGPAPTGGSSSGSVEPAVVAPEPDAAESISGLNKAGVKLKKDGDGFVIEADFRGLTIDDSVQIGRASCRERV